MFQEPNKEYFTILENYTPAATSSSTIQSPEAIKKSFSLIDPSNVFLMNNDVLNNLNAYESKYSRYLRCQNDEFAKNVSPNCEPYGSDSYSSLERSYADLLKSMNKVANAIPNQTTKDAVSPNDYKKNNQDIKVTHKELVELRRKLDEKLQNLYNEYDVNPESAQAQLNSAIYANTLWTILATCLLYYIFVEMR